jgi:hypothetical protein
MTDEEIAKLAKAIVKEKGAFWVAPEAHYQSHERLDRLLSLYDTAQSLAIRIVIGAFIAGVLAIAAFGVTWSR